MTKGLLQHISATTGNLMPEMQLVSPPILDGIAAAHGKLYFSCEDGSLVAFSKPLDINMKA